MSLNHLAHVALRHLYSGAIFGFGGAVLGRRINQEHNPSIDSNGNPKKYDIPLSQAIYTVAIGMLYLGSSMGRAAGTTWIPSHKKWYIVKPAAEMVLELLITNFFGIMILAASRQMKKPKDTPKN